MTSPPSPPTEEEVELFLSQLKAGDNDKKVDTLQYFVLRLDGVDSLPESTFDALTLSTAPFLRSTSHLLLTATLTSFLPIYLPLLPLSPTSPHLRLAETSYLAALLEKLNDPKQATRDAAALAIQILGRKAYGSEGTGSEASGPAMTAKGKEKEGLVGYWERLLRDTLGGKGWRGKVDVMRLVVRMKGELGGTMSLKPWLGVLVDSVEDGDSNVRDQAKETVVALLSPASTPPAARMELKKLMLQRGVRKTIADGILVRVFGVGPAVPIPGVEQGLQGVDEVVTTNETARSGFVTPAGGDEIEVVYLASGRDVEGELHKMLPHFEGKETEHNWGPRERSIVRIRGMLKGQAFERYPDAVVAGLKAGLMDGISKTLLSLRTTVAQQSCSIVLELAERLKSALDIFVEHLLGVLGKMAGFTKKLIADKSQRCVTAIIIHSTCHPRIFINHISASVGDKNVAARHHTTAHLKTVLDVHGGPSRHTIETTSTLLDQLENAVRRPLADVNPQVRDLARAAFWSFHAVWPSRAEPIMHALDGTGRKQLEKAKPGEANGSAIPGKPPAPPKAARASSVMSQLLAEKRKAKAAELAAGSMAQDSPRTVSGPVPRSPSIPQGLPRSISQSVIAPRRTVPFSRTITSPEGSPVAKSTGFAHFTAKANSRAVLPDSPRDIPSRSRSSSLARTLSAGPSSPQGSPTEAKSPLRQAGITGNGNGVRSPASSSATSVGQALKTPTQPRLHLPSSDKDRPVGLGMFTSPEAGEAPRHDSSAASTRANGGDRMRSSGSIDDAVQDALRAQAAQAESAAHQLLDFTEDDRAMSPNPVTPARSTIVNGNKRTGALDGNLLKTPVNSFLNGNASPGQAWEDSPRPEAMTPLLMDRLKERKHGRSWWLKRQQLLDKASPLKSAGPRPSASVIKDVDALSVGKPEMRNLQKLALFATSHPISSSDEEDEADARRVWEEGRLFERVFSGLMTFLDATRPTDLLEQALVLLWEMIQHQWVMFEDHDTALCDALFRLRECKRVVILESSNSLVSFLTEVSDPLFFLSVLRASLDRFLLSHPPSTSDQKKALPDTVTGSSNGERESHPADDAHASGYLFGLNAIGMCILRLPREVVEVEGRRLQNTIMDGLGSAIGQVRQAANILILAIQSVLGELHLTLGLLPDLSAGQKDLATYLMERHGLLKKGCAMGDGEEDGRERVAGEMAGLLARGVLGQ